MRNRTTSTQMCQACSLACHSFTLGNLLKTHTYIYIYPIGSMYGIYANIWGILMVNVTIYGIHGSYGCIYIYIYWKPMDIPPMCLKWSCSRFDRVKHLLPSQLGDEKLLGLNRRWRFYRYFSGNLRLGSTVLAGYGDRWWNGGNQWENPW